MLNEQTLSPRLGFRFSYGLSEVERGTGHLHIKANQNNTKQKEEEEEMPKQGYSICGVF